MADGERRQEVSSVEAFIWGWGAGTDGQLGIGVLEDRHSPQPLRLPSEPEDGGELESASEKDPTLSLSATCATVSIVRIACGGAHAVALTCGGKVISWGRGSHGQLGHGEPKTYCKPKFVKHLLEFTVTHVSAGWNHSGFVTDGGLILTCGDGSYGQLGHGSFLPQYLPAQVAFFDQKHVEQIECGMRHSIVLVRGLSCNSVYSFGSGKHGQLGIPLSGSHRLYNSPQIVIDLDGVTVASIHANGDHSAYLLTNGQLYVWGKSFKGRMNNCLPHKIESDMKFNQIALGWNHAVTLTDNGELYMLGGYRHGMLSCVKQELTLRNSQSDEASTLPTLRRIFSPGGEKIVQIAAGAEHSAAVSERGDVMMWGWGEHGQLGLGDCLNHTQLQFVNLPGGRSTVTSDPPQLKVYCGSGFTFVVKSCPME